MKITTWSARTIWNTTMKSFFLTVILIPLICVKGKTLPVKDTSKTLPYQKSNKSFFKLPKRGEHIDGAGRFKRDSLEFVGTVEAYSSDEKNDILQKHLDLRAGVTPEASNMEYMVRHVL